MPENLYVFLSVTSRKRSAEENFTATTLIPKGTWHRDLACQKKG